MIPVDPLKLKDLLWPDVTFYNKQREAIYSVRDDDETYVPAGNMLGKDFVAAFIVLWFFLSRFPCKIVTTSVKDKHLNVLWGEIDKFIRISKYPLLHSDGGPLIINNDGIRRVFQGRIHKDCYVMKLVANEESIESFQGHHVTPDPGQPIDNIPRNMLVGDEASGLTDAYYTLCKTWARRMFIFGNTWSCTNFFYRAVKGNPETKDPGGDILAPCGTYYYRRVLKWRAEDSPNVRYGMNLIKKYGEEEVNRRDILKTAILIPGVLPYLEYLKRRATWNKIDQCVSLDAEFYEGAEERLFPPEWLNEAERLDRNLRGKRRQAKTIGLDSGEGSADTTMIAVDELGMIDMISKKTPDTSVIVGEAIAFMNKHGVKAENVLLDRGGGGKQHADVLRSKGYNVRTVFFGEAATAEKKRGMTILEQRKLDDETRSIYKNRRAQMYGILSSMLDPSVGDGGFAIPAEYTELRRQMAPIPRDVDQEGKLVLLPKRNLDPKSDKPTMISLLGSSPDEMDALVLAVFGLTHEKRVFTVQSMVG